MGGTSFSSIFFSLFVLTSYPPSCVHAASFFLSQCRCRCRRVDVQGCTEETKGMADWQTLHSEGEGEAQRKRTTRLPHWRLSTRKTVESGFGGTVLLVLFAFYLYSIQVLATLHRRTSWRFCTHVLMYWLAIRAPFLGLSVLFFCPFLRCIIHSLPERSFLLLPFAGSSLPCPLSNTGNTPFILSIFPGPIHGLSKSPSPLALFFY